MRTVLHLHSQYTVAPVDPRIFGGFLEHMGRAVYQGVYQPDSAHADEEGIRRDVTDALRRLRMTAMRYPGGNFASGYHWRDGIGPSERRPRVRELAWQSIEPNSFGTDEFIALARKMDWTPMLTVNLGTGTPEEARDWVEYCNCPAGTRFADMRAANGSTEPYGVPLWCLGNEMDGPWQLGHVPAEQYAIRAQQAAKMMKDADSSIEVVACGSCGVNLPTYMEWDRVVLGHIGDLADYVSLHRYVGNRNDDTADFLAMSNAVDRQIEEMDAMCRFVQARRKSRKRAFLCFDEWNVWYKARGTNGEGKHAPHLIEEVYNLEDALVVAGFLNSFIRHADSVKIANIAQIVNVIAPILTRGDEMLVQSIFHPFEMMSKRRQGTAMQIALEGPTYASASYGEATRIDASAILGEGVVHAFLVNRSTDTAEVRIAPADFDLAESVCAEILDAAGDPKAANSYERPDIVSAAEFDDWRLAKGALECKMPPLSMVALTARIAH